MAPRLGHESTDAVFTGKLTVKTAGKGFVEITRQVENFISDINAGEGVVFVFLRHTSASLVIQENAALEVRSDLTSALERLAPEDGQWCHDSEGPDDMPSHIKAMLTGVSLHLPVIGGRLALGTWQGLYVAEHRARPHRREVVLQFIGARHNRAGTEAQAPR
jgi:secondary thiamine-phosphate synthase enzyme